MATAQPKQPKPALPQARPAGLCSRVRIRIVLVDDDDLYREVMAGDLEDRGYAVVDFADGAALLAAVQAGLAAEAVLIDWSLPQMPGLDVLRALRAQGCALPVAFLTGRLATSTKARRSRRAPSTSSTRPAASTCWCRSSAASSAGSAHSQSSHDLDQVVHAERLLDEDGIAQVLRQVALLDTTSGTTTGRPACGAHRRRGSSSR